MTDLKHYIVINRPLVESLARQMSLPVDQEQTVESQLGLAGKLAAGIRTSRKRSPLPPDDPRLLDPIVEKLRDSGQLRIYRPAQPSDFWNERNEWYVYEEAIATPVLIPVNKVLPEIQHPPQALTVWVIGPVEPSTRPRRDASNQDPFVFIIQGFSPPLAEHRDFWSTASPISTFWMVCKIIENKGNARPGQKAWNMLAGWQAQFHHAETRHQQHPVKKLELFGGTAGRPRKIETIYKVAFMATYEVNWLWRTGDRSKELLDDILAYPLYIAEV
jgi:hypothetical protein